MKLSRFGIILTVAWFCIRAALANTAWQASSAVDVLGRRHVCEKGAPGTTTPWMADCLRGVSLEYPVLDRARHHEGKGMFRIILDPKTGRVSEVSVINSTGFQSLDKSAVAGLHKWRWKAGLWKEIDIPVTFQMKDK
jgi:TonB family protein